ncbi:prenyltransferase [Enemella sp. A6]|uniref:prenyltransferase n=1 Tax=Enemella sp. A6 TaxID=3440152 RepID=UPI003EBDF13E
MVANHLPVVPGIISAEQLRRTANSIVRSQLPSGAIPWFPGGHVDPWDHVQAAMGLSVAGRYAEAALAYEWLRLQQRPDGTWPAKYVGNRPVEHHTDANFCAYLATGVWHHWTITGDDRFRVRMWPVVRRAIEAVLALQSDQGPIAWARDTAGNIADDYLVTGNASIHLSLRSAAALAAAQGVDAGHWLDAAARLRHALDDHPELYTHKSRYSMDWYYPVLGGSLPHDEAAARIDARWDDFVVPDLGIRCVDDHPWVTGAETCELVLALTVLDRPDAARQLFADMQHLRDADTGHYWTGLVFSDGKRWPVEVSTWTSATVLLAADAITRTTAASEMFRGAGLPAGTFEGACECQAS